MTTELIVTGMTCGHCQTAVTKALQAVPGVENVSVDLESGTAQIQGQANEQALIAAVKDEGYGAQLRS
ncbi:heavy-metal-associated domain-containing protein [Deinococcus rubellus]|uniref:CopZ family metallochaperone n=1 Tax=Deinococcus rubellus TaxID=1889240 RepID=UPI0031ED7041